MGFLLSYMDSNHKRLNQNQLCYHYTIAQYTRSLMNGSLLGVQK